MGGRQASGVFRRRDGVLARRIAGEAMLVPISGDLARLQCIFALTPVGEFIWEQLDGRKALPEILEAVLSEFEADRAQAEADLREFMARLQSEDLVEEIPGAGD